MNKRILAALLVVIHLLTLGPSWGAAATTTATKQKKKPATTTAATKKKTTAKPATKPADKKETTAAKKSATTTKKPEVSGIRDANPIRGRLPLPNSAGDAGPDFGAGYPVPLPIGSSPLLLRAPGTRRYRTRAVLC